MPEPPSLQVSGTVQARDGAVLLVLDSRLEGHDTFLAGHLDLDDGPSLPVRIITLDEMTVLRPAGPAAVRPGRWSGALRLRHGLRPVVIPADLASAAAHRRRAVSALDDAERRYAVTFLGEASTPGIRAARVAAIVSALPEAS
jgi:hypothetical protein